MKLHAELLTTLLATLAGAAAAADRSVTLDTGDVFSISWGADWVVGTNPPAAASLIHRGMERSRVEAAAHKALGAIKTIRIQ